MHARLRGAVVVVAVSLAAGLAGCGKAGGAGDPGGGAFDGGGVRIGLLFPDNQAARYERFDRPLVEKRIKELCGECTVEHANAQGDAATQHRQVDSMITQGVQVLVLDVVDAKSLRSAVSKADRAGIPVVAYDRLAQGPISAYVSYDPDRVDRLQGEALLKALDDRAGGGRIVMMNGPPITLEAVSHQKRAPSILKGKVKVGKEYTVASLSAEEAYTRMSAAITALGADQIDGVYAANDTLAAGAIAALKDAHLTPLPPVTGQDAELAAVQRILRGDQYMSVYKPHRPQADAAAEMAVALARGKNLDHITKDTVDSPTAQDIPAVLLTPVPVTADTVKDTVVKDDIYTIDQICTPKFASACHEARLTE